MKNCDKIPNPWASVKAEKYANVAETLEAQFGVPSEDNPVAYAAILHGTAGEENIFYGTKNFAVFSPDTGNWTTVSDRQVMRMMRDAIALIAHSQGDDEDEGVFGGANAQLLKRILEELKILLDDGTVHEPDRSALHVANGFLLLNVDGVTFVENKDGRKFYSRKSLSVEYSPEAECQRFKILLKEAGLDDADQKLLQEGLGQILLPQGNIAQRIFLIDGPGGSGKSTVLRTIVNLLGEEEFAILHAAFGNRHELPHYAGKRALLGMDLPPDALLRDGWALKALTGGDFLQGTRRGSGREVSFYGNLSVILTSNDRLRLNLGGINDVSAFRRRLAHIPFVQVPATPSPFLQDELLAEASGVLNWLIEGALRVLKRGRIDLTEAQQARVDAILGEANSPAAFVASCVAKGEPGDSATIAELLDAYCGYCAAQGWQPLSERRAQREIRRALVQAGLVPADYDNHGIRRHDRESQQTTSSRGFLGLKIK